MRRLTLLAIGSLVLLGALSPQTQIASAKDPEPDCAGRADGIQGFHALTVPPTPAAIADLYVGTALCGTRMRAIWLQGAYAMAYVVTAGDMDAQSGVATRCANPAGDDRHRSYCEGSDLPAGAYAGSSYMSLLQCIVAGQCERRDSRAGIWVYDAGTKNGPVRDSRCRNAATAVQCFQAKVRANIPNKGERSIATIDIVVQPCWAVERCRRARAPDPEDLDPQQDRYLVTFYLPESLINPDADIYFLEIGKPSYTHPGGDPGARDLHLCARANLSGEDSCGTSDADWVYRNPPAGSYGCSPSKPEGYGADALGVGTIGKVPEVCYPHTWE